MTTPISVANVIIANRYRRMSERSVEDRYWESLRKRVQAGASLRNVRPAPNGIR